MSLEAPEAGEVAARLAPPLINQTGLDAGDDPNENHLRTDHLLTNLKSRTVSAAAVTIISQFILLGLNFVSIFALARLLTPRDFGLFAMVTTVIGYLRVFKDAGLSTATVQRQGITQAQVSNLFWINVAISGAMTLVLAASAPLVARFYHDPRLIGITLVLSATFLLNGLVVQHTAILTRQMRFTSLAIIQVASTILGLVLSITLALLGFNYWSLVISNIAVFAATAIFTWIAIPWRPHGLRRGTETRSLVTFGANMASAGFILSLAKGTDSMLIGRLFGPDSLGLYSRAGALLARPMEQLMSPIGSVFMPVLARVQSDPLRYRKLFMRVYEVMSLLSALCGSILFVLAKPLTLVVLGQKWEEAAPIFAALSATALFSAPTTAATWLFASQGRGSEWLRTSGFLAAIAFTSYIAGIRYGAFGVAMSASIIGICVGLPTLFFCAGRRGPVVTRDLWSGLLKYLPIWFFVSAVTYFCLRLCHDLRPLIKLSICVPTGLLAGLLMIFVVPPMRRTGLELVDLARAFGLGRGQDEGSNVGDSSDL